MMQTHVFTALSDKDMMKIGESLIPLCQAPCVIFLKGDLGAGKTTLVRGFLRGLGYQGPVKSPTYTLVEQYEINEKTIVHFDLYRLQDPEELALMGIRDYFNEKNICFIEWPQQGLNFLPPPDVFCEISFLDPGREIKISCK